MTRGPSEATFSKEPLPLRQRNLGCGNECRPHAAAVLPGRGTHRLDRRGVERLHVATSAISRQITKLEQEVGAPLFERRPRGMVLPEGGEILTAYARRNALEADQCPPTCTACALDQIAGVGAGHDESDPAPRSPGRARCAGRLADGTATESFHIDPAG